MVAAVVIETLESPTDATQWSAPALAERHAISRQIVSQIWCTSGPEPWRRNRLMVSLEPDLIEKVCDLVWLYLSHPWRGLCGRGKPQNQAVNRSAPIPQVLPTSLRMRPTRLRAQWHLGPVRRFRGGRRQGDHRSAQVPQSQRLFIAFLNKIDREVPETCRCTSRSTTYPSTKQFGSVSRRDDDRHGGALPPRARRRGAPVASATAGSTSTSPPSYGSWMNLVERWFSGLKKLQRSAHHNIEALVADVRGWFDLERQPASPLGTRPPNRSSTASQAAAKPSKIGTAPI